MKIVLTAEEMLCSGKWDKFCTMRNLNPYCINEGLMTSDEEFDLNEQECGELGIEIPKININIHICKKCGSRLDNGFCTDETCPYHDWSQVVEIEDLCELSVKCIEKKYGTTRLDTH